jgi:hypothetical protein
MIFGLHVLNVTLIKMFGSFPLSDRLGCVAGVWNLDISVVQLVSLTLLG